MSAVMASWLHGGFMTVCQFFPRRCGFSLSLFCNYNNLNETNSNCCQLTPRTVHARLDGQVLRQVIGQLLPVACTLVPGTP